MAPGEATPVPPHLRSGPRGRVGTVVPNPNPHPAPTLADDDPNSVSRWPSAPLPTLQGAVPYRALDALKESTGLKGSLLVISGAVADVGTHRLVGEGVVLGREPQHLLLRDPEISRRHAEVCFRNGLHMLRDLGSTNGTALNGEPLTEEQILRNGDKIACGQTVIRFTLIDPDEAHVLEEMATLAGSDPLTGLMAKHRFDAMLADCFRSARRHGRPLSVLMMDMDGLKAINTAHGHQTGANTIAEVGRLVGRVVGLQGEACRFGGDEYSALLPGAPLGVALRVAERIRQAVEEAVFRRGDQAIQATISIGVAEMKPEMDSPGELVAGADMALYRAKDGGRNRVSD